MRHLQRLLAEHEAAHAVVAAHYGQAVQWIRVGRDDGMTHYRGTSTPRERAAITAAGDLWNREYGTVPYVDYGCGDLADFQREHGLRALWQANRDARAALNEHLHLVTDLADTLMRQRILRFDRGQLVA